MKGFPEFILNEISAFENEIILADTTQLNESQQEFLGFEEDYSDLTSEEQELLDYVPDMQVTDLMEDSLDDAFEQEFLFEDEDELNQEEFSFDTDEFDDIEDEFLFESEQEEEEEEEEEELSQQQ